MARISKGFALITGASTGIGAIYADRLAGRGYDLILVARNEQQLNAVAAAIVDKAGSAVEIIVADLTEDSGLQKVEDVLRSDDRITMLVNNAGIASTTPLIRSDVSRMSKMLDINVNAVMRLTYAAVPAFVSRGTGTVINIASVVAIGPEILNGVYGASKAFVLAFSQSLRHELAETGVRVQVVLPGATATEIWDDAGTPLTDLPHEMVMPAAEMVDAALVGLDSGEFTTFPALAELDDWNVYEAARQRLLPNLSRRQPAARYSDIATR